MQKKPNIYDFTSPAEIMIVKNCALLNMKKDNGQITPMEEDMLNGTHHSNQLCLYYYSADFMRHYFTSSCSMDMNFNDCVKELVAVRYNPAPGELGEAVDYLLKSASGTLLAPINGVFPCEVSNEYGQVIICYDIRKEVNHMILDRKWVGFTSFFVNNIRNGVRREDILNRISDMVRSYLIPEDHSWMNNPSLSNPDINNYIAGKAEEIYTQLLYCANNGGNNYA